ncbi:MAG: 2'-deoxycytidine 5'-triphosphate deaminase [Nanoarchaeota archaeon]|nr:2'-deoxycytidine 5'-triphosphate deaminase [Nanoarchaeota archaeon]
MSIGILPKTVLETAETENIFVVKNRLKMSATSIDIRVARLFKRNDKPVKFTIDDVHYNPEEIFEEVEPEDGMWILKPHEVYEAETVEDIHKIKGLRAEINSRSSWARYGVFCSADWVEGLRPHHEFHGKIRFSLRTFETTVAMKVGEAPAQIRCMYLDAFALDHNILNQLKKENQIAEGASLDRQGFTLTMDDKVHVYKSGVLGTKQSIEDCFETIDIKKGLILEPRTFYIASSREIVKIPCEFIGYVNSTDSYIPQLPHQTGPVGICGSQWLHASAPWVDPYPVFHGKLTFENWTQRRMRIEPGMRLTELQLKPLLVPYEHEAQLTSRYKGQNQAQISKGHLDKDRYK